MLKKQALAAEKLLEIAGPLFAENTFEALSTREIADRAGVNLSAISYHFGGKEGLYRAVLQKIIDELSFVRKFLAQFMEENLSQATGRPDLQRLMVKTIVHQVVGAVTANANPRWRMKLLLRELQSRGPCFDLVCEGHVNIVHNILGQMVAVIIGQPETSERVKVLTHSLIGMCLQFGLNEAFLSSRLGWDKYGPAEVQALQDHTTLNAWALLGILPQEKAE